MRKQSRGRVVVLWAIVIALIAGAPIAIFLSQKFAQPTLRTAPVAASPPATIQALRPSTDQEIAELRSRIDELSAFKDSVDSSLNVLEVVLGALGIIILLAGGASLVGYLRADSLSKESHELFVKGEKAAQDRADSIFASSRETLEFVNTALSFANEASRSASKAVEEKGKEEIKRLDGQSKLLIDRLPEEDTNELVSNPTLRSDVMNLARKIDDFEGRRFSFPTLPGLTPHALFIRAMSAHLNQHFDEPIELWTEVALMQEAPDPLKTIAWYWIGLEQDNLGMFVEAERSFKTARKTASAVMDLELQRIILETQFFNTNQSKASDLVDPLEELLGSAEADVASKVIARIWTTLGNVCTEAGDECKANQAKKRNSYYDRALELFTLAQNENIWALSGKADVLYTVGDQGQSRDIYRTLRSRVVDEYRGRTDEPRAKVVTRAMEFVCCIRVPEFRRDALTVEENLYTALHQVHDRLTIYSQVQHRNVTKQQFERDIEQLRYELKDELAEDRSWVQDIPVRAEAAPATDRHQRVDEAIIAGYTRIPPTSGEDKAALASLREAIAEELW
ncbi:MAG: hypothetical protein ACRDYA_17610 [Egibacteraceae bacterium]